VKVSGTDEPEFRMREIELGPALSNAYVVLNGLQEGEEIVTNGAFAVDAAAQLAGKPSMMNHPMTSSHRMSGTDQALQMVHVSGNCDMCKERIETAVKSVSGVASADWDADRQMLHVQFDPTKTNLDNIQKTVAAAGHDTEKYKAPDNAYNQLPTCCLYRKKQK
jgi:Cu(I)/Ag(I) efflux system membrane fusion protein